jgi:predicted Rossmann fold flavoprotein
MKVAVIGGGAAGFFAAITCAQLNPNAQVMVYEKTSKLLAKVKVSGGGRCNVTHACFSNAALSKHYPRGGKVLKKAFSQFNASDTVEWFESRGVKLKTEADNRMFPITDDSQTIVDCLLKEASRLGVTIHQKMPVNSIKKVKLQFALDLGVQVEVVDKVIIATGGSPKEKSYEWLGDLGHEVRTPVPSLFTFNMPNESIKELMGVSVSNAQVRIQGENLENAGPLLITHWGMSGPAILKSSAWGARLLHDKAYHFTIQVNWLGDVRENQLREDLVTKRQEINARNMGNRNPFGLPQRIWDFLLIKNGIDPDQKWRDLPKKEFNKLINTLLNDVYEVIGKTTFKEEFVTCGGVSMESIQTQTMESKYCEGMYFAGEVLDIDGVTGGFNFQAAWTTGYIAGKSASA